MAQDGSGERIQFLGPSVRREYKITDTKLGTKVDVDLEREKNKTKQE